jgi:hypothetical protein
MASIFLRWRRGIIPSDSDFLQIREQALHPDYFGTTDEPVYFLVDILGEPLAQMASDYVSYYLTRRGELLPGQLITTLPFGLVLLLQAALGRVILHAAPEAIHENATIGSEWSRFVLEHMRQMLFKFLDCHQLDLTSRPDQEFRRTFEKEWKILLAYQDSLYGFRVIPKLSLEDMMRYQQLKKGDPQIRRTISTYITHQATEYPHLLHPYAPELAEKDYESLLRRMYDPLIQTTVRQALKNSSVLHENRQQIRADLLKEVEEQFQQARQAFSFYWEKAVKERPLGKIGFLSYPQTSEGQKELDALLQQRTLPYTSRDFMEVSFATYIRQRLRSWLESTYPADKQTDNEISIQQAPTDSDRALEEELSQEDGVWNEARHTPTPEVFGPDGTGYFTVKQAARYYGLSVDQLRRFDREGFLPAYRVRDIFEKPYPLKPDMRLYAVTEETRQAIEVIKARLAKHSTHLQGQEVDRKTAAMLLGVHVTVLRKLENEGRLQPLRRGRIVSYDENTIAQARALLKKQP